MTVIRASSDHDGARAHGIKALGNSPAKGGDTAQAAARAATMAAAGMAVARVARVYGRAARGRKWRLARDIWAVKLPTARRRAGVQSDSWRRASARAWSRTSRTGRDFSRAIRTTSANSGVIVITRPSSRETLNGSAP